MQNSVYDMTNIVYADVGSADLASGRLHIAEVLVAPAAVLNTSLGD